MAIATGFGAGYLPWAPGTWGSLLALPLHALLSRMAPGHHALALGGVFLIAVLSAGAAEKILDRKDPGVVVIDEVMGMLITLIAAPANPLAWLLGFGLFRFFDILKPWPVRFLDQRLNGGLGVVLDDVMAGLYAFAALQVFCRLIPALS